MPNDHFEQLLEQLKLVANDADFDKIFRSMTADEDGPTRFQLKMELRRLTAPCLQTVDLRNRVAGRCEPYEFLGRRHYFDSVAKDIFERGLRTYNGVFTQDTFEQILAAENNNRVMQEQERELALARKNQHAERVASREEVADTNDIRSPYLVDTFHFGNYPYRNEERMNFTVDVELHLSHSEPVKAVTSDISVTGLRVRVDESIEFHTGQQLGVCFTGLAKDFTINPEVATDYEIVAIDTQQTKTYISLNRTQAFADESFERFLEQFIGGYKKRYRVNIDNTYQALLNKGHEQFLMPRLTALPIYFAVRNKQLAADFVLTTDNNRHIVEDWINEHNETTLGSIFNQRRSQFLLKKLLKDPTQSATFLSFNITARGKVYYYSALAEELEKTDLWDTFINFAAQKSSFRAYRFNLRQLDTANAWQPQAVPQSIAIPFRQQPPTERVQHAIAPLRYLGVLDDITATVRPFAAESYDKTKVKSLKAFLHPPAAPIRTKDVRLEFVDLRREQRFSYRSRCRVRVGKQLREGMIIDLSIHGLKVQLDDSINEATNKLAHVTLSAFQKVHKNFQLNELNYEIINHDQSATTLNLKVPEQEEQHNGRHFFAYLIKEHRDSLRLLHENTALNGIELCLRNLYCQAPPSVPLFLYQNNKRHITLRRAGVSSWQSGWLQLLKQLPGSNERSLNVQPVLRGSNLTTEVIPAMQQLTRSDRPITKLLLIKLYREQGEEVLQTEWQTVDSEDSAFINAFIEQCLPASIFFAIKLDLSRAGRPDIQFVQAELNYLTQYAAHRANELEEELWQVFGLAVTSDITDNLLAFADLDPQHRLQQRQRRQQWLNQ